MRKATRNQKNRRAETRGRFSYLRSFSLALILLISQRSIAQTGTWTAVKNLAPQQSAGLMLVLTDGRILCQNIASGTTGWMILTPDVKGSYANGTWSTTGSNIQEHLFGASQVFPNGKVLMAGGEYGVGDTSGEIYDPVVGTWSRTGGVAGKQNLYDCNSMILYDGRVLVGGQAGPSNNSTDCEFYNPKTNAWTIAPNSPLNHDECDWVKLADSTILMVGMQTLQSCRYNPKTNTWLTDANLPPLDSLYDAIGAETGCGLNLPNGKVIFFGGNMKNAIYTPSGTTAPGSWVAGPQFPLIGGLKMGVTDGPGVIMVNGHCLICVSPIGYNPNNNEATEFNDPTYFLEYDYVANTFTQVMSLIPGLGTADIATNTCSNITFLELPDGTVLVDQSQNGTASANQQFYIYTPGGTAIAAGKPTIGMILPLACPSYKITGTLFNGISVGTSYGDDLQQASNYPLVRLVDASGDVYYCKTTNWNRIGAVQTGNAADTCTFQTPAGLPAGTYSLYVVVNGFASNPVTFTTLQPSTYTVASTACNGVVAATPVKGGLAPYTYLWTTGSQTTDTIKGQCAGTYCCTVKDADGCTVSSCITVNTTTGISNPTESTTINLYPDPNTGYFTLDGLTEGDVVEVYNALGQQVQRKRADNGPALQFDITSYPKGVYFIKLLSKDGNFLLEKKAIKAQ